MKRRGFMGALAAVVTAPFVAMGMVKAKPDPNMISHVITTPHGKELFYDDRMTATEVMIRNQAAGDRLMAYHRELERRFLHGQEQAIRRIVMQPRSWLK